MKRVPIEARIDWFFFRDSESEFWIAVCPALGQTVSGETWAELNGQIAETLDLLFNDLMEKGELDSFLRSHGWTMKEIPSETSEDVRFDVPWQLVDRQGAYDQEGVLC